MNNFEDFLPFGETLRPLLIQSYLGKGDLKELLRRRGVFTSVTEKDITIPALCTNLITPSELDTLKLTYSTKEENPKVTSQTLEWTNTTPLIECLPDNIDINKVVNLDFKNYEIIGTPSFTPINSNPNHVSLEFEVERIDKSNSWIDHSKTFKGSIEIVYEKGASELIITNTHTSPETREVITKLSNSLVSHFKEASLINDTTEIKRILFSDFDNSNRFEYLLALTKKSRYTCLNFNENVDAGISPDKEISPPPKIEWLKEKIKNLNLSGNSLDETLFFENELRSYLVLHRLDCDFRFSIAGHDGNCIMSFSFPEYAMKHDDNAELEVKIKSITFEDTRNAKEKSNIKLTILKEIEHEKIEKYKSLRLKTP